MATEKRRVSPANQFAVRSGKSEIKSSRASAEAKQEEEDEEEEEEEEEKKRGRRKNKQTKKTPLNIILWKSRIRNM